MPHPEATLRSDVTSVRAGTAWPVRGEKFVPGDTIRLVQQGALSESALRSVQAAADSTFAVSLDIPRDVRPGAYRLAALADDGDVVASLEVTIEAAAPVVIAEHEMAGGRDVTQRGGEARADELPIERSRSGAEWGVIGLLIGLAGGFGLSLLRRPA